MVGISLTGDAIASICNGTGTAENPQPIVQVVDLKLLQTAKNGNGRYRLILSDGKHALQAMLATQNNIVVESGALQKGSVVRLNEFICNTIQNRKIIIVLRFNILFEKCDTIGKPKSFDGRPARSSTPAQPSSGDQSGIAAANQPSHGSALAYGPPIVPMPPQLSSGDQSGTVTANQRSHGGALANGHVAGQTMTGGA